MPLFKKGEKSDVRYYRPISLINCVGKSFESNYRPISLISCVGKSFERIVHKHIYNHITAHFLICKHQSGFLPGHLTVHHLIELMHHTCLALEKSGTICHVFISKAFHRVWHRCLIHKLKKVWNPRRSFRLASKLSVYAEPKSICQRHFLITKVYSCRSSSRISPGSSFHLDLYK